MDLQRLRTFVAVADAGGVAKAAARLNLSQPAASRQVQMLEAELGVPLFDRIGRSVRLTTAGEDLLQRSRRLLAEAEELRERARALRAGNAGTVAVGATPPMIELVLAGFLAGFRRRHPEVDVRVVEDGGAGLVARLERGEVQVAYVPAGDERFAGRLLYPVHVVAAVPDGHGLHRRRTIEVGELAGEPLLLLRRGFGSREWFDLACRAADVRPTVLLESGAHNAVIGLAAAGYGVGILPSAVRLPDGVRAIPLTSRQAPIGRWTMLAWDPRRFLAPYVEAFVDELVRHARRTYPGAALLRGVPPLDRPKLPRAS
ncbi:MAG TPA: LysR family transcriptional regulator [Hyphomicrobiaceae bacterium]|nr:LysR family transcriptional regulator [Hyphomicrobiaceae bacterium]